MWNVKSAKCRVQSRIGSGRGFFRGREIGGVGGRCGLGAGDFRLLRAKSLASLGCALHGAEALIQFLRVAEAGVHVAVVGLLVEAADFVCGGPDVVRGLKDLP